VHIIMSLKKRLHREIASDPVLHGLVLNLYLNGEQYPHHVEDYFPLAAVEEPELDELMRSHMRDEDKHVTLYIKAITELGQPVQQLPMNDVYNEVIRRHTKDSFAMTSEDDSDARRFKLANFLAHLHFLEKRIAHSLEYHAEACIYSPVSYSAKAVSAVLKDEYKHVTYTKHAVEHLLPAKMATSVLAKHERAERRANLDFSGAQLRKLVREHGNHFGAGSRVLYRSCSSLMGRMANYV
jgi:hypothetical protein